MRVGEKKRENRAPARQTGGIVSELVGKTTLLQEIGFSNSHSPKFLKPKMLPPNCLTHYQSAVSIFPSKKIDSKGICQKNRKIQKIDFNYSLFSP